MKYFVRSNQYRASNVYFDVATREAFSYSWWKFFAVIEGRNIFNHYSYSNSTCKHQNKVRSLLRKLGIEIDLSIEAPKGLQNLSHAKDWNEQQLPYYLEKEKRARKDHSRNYWNSRAREAQDAINFIKSLPNPRAKESEAA